MSFPVVCIIVKLVATSIHTSIVIFVRLRSTVTDQLTEEPVFIYRMLFQMSIRVSFSWPIFTSMQC
ncbi:MAG TPA: hypothetical protein DCP58_03255 [Verrucomicrobiales bacterium]|nr:hypothetical protein [Verrucomicrobiales bacterium]